MIYDEIIKEIFQSLLNRYQIGLKHQWKGIYLNVNLLHYRSHKINLKRGGSYIDSPDWIKNKKATINPIIDVLSLLCNSRIKPLRKTKKTERISKLSLL